MDSQAGLQLLSLICSQKANKVVLWSIDMDDPSPHHTSERKQLLSYLLLPPCVFLCGYALAIVFSSLAKLADQSWLDPVSWGCVLTLVYLAQSLPLSRSNPYYSFGPKPPSSRKSAVAFAVSTAIYAIIVCKLLLFWQRDSIEKAFPSFPVVIIVVLAPVVICFGCYHSYQTYQVPKND